MTYNSTLNSSKTLNVIFSIIAALSLVVISNTANAATTDPLRIGVVTFLSGPAAGPFGVPAANAAKMLVRALNNGQVPDPYSSSGIAGAEIEIILVDESGGVTKQVTEFRNLVQRRKVSAVIGYISSGSCLGIAPVAEEMKMLTVFHTCGTPRIFEEADYRYVFRTASHSAMDGIGAARYLLDRYPELKSYAGINPNYAWGHDSWRDFEGALKVLSPVLTFKTHQLPKLFAGQYNAEISALLVKRPDAVHSSLFGGDLEAFTFQVNARDLHERTRLILTTGETMMFQLAEQLPEGLIIGARGPYGAFAKDTPLSKWFREKYQMEFGTPPTFPAYMMTQAILGLKTAFESAQTEDTYPDTEAVVDSFSFLKYTAIGTTVNMALGNGHQAITGTAYGEFARDPDTNAPILTNVITYRAECVNPPPNVDTVEWIEQGMPGAKCK